MVTWGCVATGHAGPPVKTNYFGVEYWKLSLSVPAQRYTGTEIESAAGAALDLYLSSSLSGYTIKDSWIVAQSDEADQVMWYKMSPTFYKVDWLNMTPSAGRHPEVQNSREWLEVKGLLVPVGGGSGPGGGGLSFTGDVVSADLDVAHGSGEAVDETVEESQGAYFPVGTNAPAKLTLRCLQYKNGIGASKRVELHKMQASADVHVYSNSTLTCEVTNWPVVTTHGALKNNPRYFYITSDTNSASARDIEFEARSFELDTGGYASDRVRLTALKVDMTAHRPQTQGPGYGNPFPKTPVSEGQEETPGTGIRVNGDDDNVNGTADRNDSTVNNENDLIEVTLDAAPPAPSSGLKYVLKRSASNIKVWNSQNKGTAWLDANDETNLPFSTTPMTVWVENPNGGDDDLELQAKTDSGTVVCADMVHFYDFTSIIAGISGEDWWFLGGNYLDNGMYDIATNLYGLGYDVHYFDEDDVEQDGGVAYAEITNAIRTRAVSEVGVYGHSHGGGSVFYISESLNSNRVSIGMFTIKVTAYVDAISNEGTTDYDPETNRPPSTAYHANYYETNSATDIRVGYLNGEAVPEANVNLNVNTTAWGATLGHTTIDTSTNVHRLVIDKIIGNVSR